MDLLRKTVCFFTGHSPEYIPSYSDSELRGKTVCSVCGKVPIYRGEEENLIERHISLQVILWSIVAILAFILFCTLVTVAVTPLLYATCAQQADAMGLEFQYKFFAGCLVHHPTLGWIPFDKLFVLLSGQ